jgi:predicted  nucleic acid-binding Zn-ribbon protein
MTEKRLNGADDRDAKAVEAGLAMHLRVKSDLEDARKEINGLLQQITLNKIEIEGMQSRVNMLESRVVESVAARDVAVEQHAKLQGLFEIIFASMREFQIPNVPFVRKVEEKQNAHRTNPT